MYNNNSYIMQLHNSLLMYSLHVHVIKYSTVNPTGAINDDARDVVDDLNRSLAKQAPSTAQLLEQAARKASPVILPQSVSLGPVLVTDSVRTKERAEKGAAREPPTKIRKTQPKKVKEFSPEMEERQRRASARMLELGIPTHQASLIYVFPLSMFIQYTCI